MQWYIRFLPGRSGAEFKCTYTVQITHKLVQQSRQQALRAYYPTTYTVIVSLCTEFPRTGRQFHFATIHIKKYGAANVLQICTFHMFRTVQLGKFFS